MLLEDLDFVEGITGMIENDKVNAEYAVFVTGEQCAALFLSMDDDYMRGRAADVNDISSRLIAILSGTQVSAEAMPEPVIIMAEDLAPSETVQFEKDKILALVTQKGSANSHTAILARMMNIPCIVTADIDLDPELTGKDGIVDGFTGKIYIEPDEVTTAVMTEKKKREEERKLLLQSLKGLPTVTTSICIPISEVKRMWMLCWQMTPRVSVCSAVSSCIWAAIPIRPRRSSSRYIRTLSPR